MLKSKEIFLDNVTCGLEDVLFTGASEKRNLGSYLPPAGGRKADTRV
jgi:hypothetical protein